MENSRLILPEHRLAWKLPGTETGSGDSACSTWFATHKVSDTNVKAPRLTLRFYTKRILPLGSYLLVYAGYYMYRYIYLEVEVVFGGASFHKSTVFNIHVWGWWFVGFSGGGITAALCTIFTILVTH